MGGRTESIYENKAGMKNTLGYYSSMEHGGKERQEEYATSVSSSFFIPSWFVVVA